MGNVVFTNGVFDILHPGHLALLEAARTEGGSLVVGVNSDASVRRLGKSPDRPIVPEQARARLLAGFAAVDCVVLFDEDTPLELIRALEPDVLVKGADYTREQIVGADFVEVYGGRVVRVELVPDHSTTRLVERLRASP
ncbi:MAG: D-glycero-beta-D-manno-heptose 1-phosphate adenylyltransferase [Gemmatimonadales bacterium]|nr:MAG: D-glycero-beta-D-manno-heptose 1-phosphate adenylyltransferase [Gemmatimonadales bacterium]